MSEQKKKPDTLSEETRLRLDQHLLKKPAEELADKDLAPSDTLNSFLSTTVASQVIGYRKMAEENHVFGGWLLEVVAKMEFAAAAYAGKDNKYTDLRQESDEVLAAYGRLFFDLIAQTDRRIEAFNQLEKERLQQKETSK